MNLEQLRDYNNWVGKSPKVILDAVRLIEGGWAKVFPDKLPVWAHRIRNYFNREPKSLLRLNEQLTDNYIKRINEGLPSASFTASIAQKYALTGDVFRDAQSWLWYQMNEGGTIYHWGSEPTFPKIEGPFQELKEKLGIPMPVFKLVAPDGTGGSREAILRNMHGTFVPVKKVDFLAYVAHLAVTDYWKQGSYNYSETVKAGYSAHVMRDVEPHTKYEYPGIYVNPPDRFSALSERIFPERVNGEPNPLANQI